MDQARVLLLSHGHRQLVRIQFALLSDVDRRPLGRIGSVRRGVLLTFTRLTYRPTNTPIAGLHCPVVEDRKRRQSSCERRRVHQRGRLKRVLLPQCSGLEDSPWDPRGQGGDSTARGMSTCPLCTLPPPFLEAAPFLD